MEIRVANLSEKADIVALYARSQSATSLPNPSLVPSAELGQRLYDRHAIERYVAVKSGRIVGHALIEPPNPEHLAIWQQNLYDNKTSLVEMGGAFVEPELSRNGIWTALLMHRLDIISEHQAIPVTATWSTNEHVKKTLKIHGGIEVGRQLTQLGEVSLFVF